ncbi:MAG TPA: hypothetical protein VMF52_16460 [Steroidobacteraceae bacterium]|nr:hypothetical protein [Steroidobacteraceae bacterium]
MAKFIPGQTTEVKAEEPTLDVVVEANSPLKVGKYVFRLVVTDDAGNESEAADVVIVVTDKNRPTAVIDVITVTGERISKPTVEIPFGQRFQLTADRSTDIGGVVKSYRWQLLQ